jgi:hypothetical protein
MPIEDIMAYKDLGIGIVAIVIIYNFSKWVSERAFKEVENANKCMMDTQTKFVTFMETTYKENTKAISELANSSKDLIRIRDDIAAITKEQQRIVECQQNMLKDCKNISEERDRDHNRT